VTRSALALVLASGLAFAASARADTIRGPGVAVCDDSARPLIGHVVAASGSVSATWQDCPPRALGCDDAVRVGDQLTTGPGARVAFQADELYVQLAPESAVQIAKTAQGAPDLTLLRGRLRAIDQQEVEVGPPHRIATSQAESLARGNDTEAFAGGSGSGLCEWAVPIEVRSLPGGALATAHPGQCVGSTGGAVAGGALAVSLTDVESCSIADTRDLSPIDVAGGPPGVEFPPTPPPVPPPPFCVAGSCGPGPSHVPVVESPAGYEPPP